MGKRKGYQLLQNPYRKLMYLSIQHEADRRRSGRVFSGTAVKKLLSGKGHHIAHYQGIIKSYPPMNYELQNGLEIFEFGNRDYVAENLQNKLLENIDFSKEPKAISFSRADFRGSTFRNITFYENDFTRADFVSSHLENCCFISCQFGPTGIHNCSFKNVTFKGNQHDSSFFTNNTFVECRFTNETITNSLIEKCNFYQCVFEGYKISKSTAIDILYDKCQLTGEDFSNMYACYFRFSSCTLKNLTLDADYIGSYLFKNCELSKLFYKYRGEELTLGKNKEDLEAISLHYLRSARFDEYFVFSLMIRSMAKVPLIIRNELSNTIDRIIESNVRVFEQLLRIIESIMFIMDSGVISLKEVSDFLLVLKNKSQLLDPLSKIRIDAELECISQNLTSGEFNCDEQSNENVMLELHFDLENIDDARRNVDILVKTVAGQSPSEAPLYLIQNIRRGSVIVDVVVYVSVAISLIRFLHNSCVKISLETACAKRIKILINEANTVQEIKELKSVFPEDANFESPNLSSITDSLKELKIHVGTSDNITD